MPFDLFSFEKYLFSFEKRDLMWTRTVMHKDLATKMFIAASFVILTNLVLTQMFNTEC